MFHVKDLINRDFFDPAQLMPGACFLGSEPSWTIVQAHIVSWSSTKDNRTDLCFDKRHQTPGNVDIITTLFEISR